MSDKGPRRGRPPATSAGEIARVALALFVREGFEATTMDQVAAAVGVSRRTLFQYFPSKSAIVWHGAPEAFGVLLTALQRGSPDAPWRTALADAVVASLQFPGNDLEALRLRLRLIDAEPSLQAHLLTDSHEILLAVARRIAAGSGAGPGDLAPFVLARAGWMAMFSALIWWAHAGDGDPRAAVRQALRVVGLGEPGGAVPGGSVAGGSAPDGPAPGNA